MDWIDRFPGLNALEGRVRDALKSRARIVSIAKGKVIFGPAHPPESLLLLLDGTVRVRHISDSGREIVLYRVHAGDSCILTNACLLAYEDHSAEGIAETDVQAVAIPRGVFDELISTSRQFREFVFSAYSKRMTDLFYIIDEIAFRKMDVRVAQKLLELQDKAGEIRATHAQLASELGTAREVVSRQLSEFQRRGLVDLGRGVVQLIDVPAIETLAAAA
ncbi:MAG: Crp/Fnr family transcriptional regulator [Rhodobacteraceae bacterium]|nr:Crp/Fnr family transcriptional regulator [Paracoccaceae bacterium]